ncbi:MAG: Fructose-1,6-bisphosphatase/inositol-1-monophosphatase [Fimbriimonadaceae bacterium]|nr:Fructose-1,6-bisphosphatase/inositol-1-monophosphatase [Fimbriimonadaceae bacterium]
MSRELKADGSIVTDADREVEVFLRHELTAWIPASFYGEETPLETPNAHGQWVVDPIDGTSNFAFGSPLWGVSVGLMTNGECVLGAIALPDLQETYICDQGSGVWMNDDQLPPIPPGPVQSHELTCFCDDLLRHMPRTAIPGKMRCPGAMVIAGAFFATQRYRACLGFREKLYDMAPCVLFARELGGSVSLANGEPLDLSSLQDGLSINQPWTLFPNGSGFAWAGKV